MSSITNYDQVMNVIGKYNDIESYIKEESQLINIEDYPDPHNIDYECKCGYFILEKLYRFCPICGRPLFHIAKGYTKDDAKSELTHKLILKRDGY